VTTLLLSLALQTARAECPATTDELQEHLDDAIEGYVKLDQHAFGDARDAGREALTCITTPLDPDLAGAYHRMEGLNGLVSQDDRRTLDSFRASVAVDPGWQMSDDVAPPGHPLREAYEAARLAPPSDRVAVSVPRCASVYVDGVRTTARPRDRPAVLQVVDKDDGAVVWSRYLTPPSEPPSWSSVPSITALDCDTPVSGVDADRGGRGLFLSSGIAAVAAGSLAAGALLSRARFDDQEYTSEATGEALREQANNRYYGAQAAGALAVGLGGFGLAFRYVW